MLEFVLIAFPLAMALIAVYVAVQTYRDIRARRYRMVAWGCVTFLLVLVVTFATFLPWGDLAPPK